MQTNFQIYVNIDIALLGNCGLADIAVSNIVHARTPKELKTPCLLYQLPTFLLHKRMQ